MKRSYYTPLGAVWTSMKQRCFNPNCKAYRNYGARGIDVCPEWVTSLEAFRSWAMANGYQSGLTLDRRDNERGYSPENCRWVDRPTQNRNRRGLKPIEHNGETRLLCEWAEATGISRVVLRSRFRNGWPTELALTLPVSPGRSLAEILAAHGTSRAALAVPDPMRGVMR